jgi:hypothetical protein
MDVRRNGWILEPLAELRDLPAELLSLGQIPSDDEEMPEAPHDAEQLRGLAHLARELMGAVVCRFDFGRREPSHPAEGIAETHLEGQLQPVALLRFRQGAKQVQPLVVMIDRLDKG